MRAQKECCRKLKSDLATSYGRHFRYWCGLLHYIQCLADIYKNIRRIRFILFYTTLSPKFISIVIFAGAANTAYANDQTRTAPATVIQMEIVNGCILNNAQSGTAALGALDFGEVYKANFPYDAVTTASNGSIVLRCTPGTSARITMNSGLYGSGVNDRRMRLSGGSGTLLYQLYTTASRQIVWDDVIGISINFTSDSTQTIPIYGRVPPQVTPASGFYSDQVLVTVNY